MNLCFLMLSKNTVKTVLGLICFLWVMPFSARGVTLKKLSLQSDEDIIVPIGIPLKFRVKAEAEGDEVIKSITFSTAYGRGGHEKARKKNCRYITFEKKTCVKETEYEWRVDTLLDTVYATVITENGQSDRVTWNVTATEDAQYYGYFILKPPNDREVQVKVGEPQQFFAGWRNILADDIKFELDGVRVPSKTPATTFTGWTTIKDEYVELTWDKAGTHILEVSATHGGRLSESEKDFTGDGRRNPETWIVIVTNNPEVDKTPEVDITPITPRNQQVRLLPKEKKEFSVKATANEKIQSITFNTTSAKPRNRQENTYRWGNDETREFSTTYSWTRPGNYTVTATAKTKSGVTDSTTWDVTVKPSNNTPKPVSPWKPQTLYVNDVIFLDIEDAFYDLDNDELDYGKVLSERDIVTAKWNDPDPKKRTLLTIFTEEPGPVDVIVTATDPDGAVGKNVLSLTVKNRGPVADPRIPNIGAKQLVVGGPAKILNLTDYFTDDDGDTLTYEYDMSKDGVVSLQEKARDILHIIPQRRNSVWVTITATDGHTDKKTATQEFRVTVGRRNRPPEIIGDDKSGTFADLKNLKLSKVIDIRLPERFRDPDNDRLIYDLKSNDNPNAIDAWIVGAFLRIKPNRTGEATLTVIANDNKPGGITELDIEVRAPGTKADLAITFDVSKDTLAPKESFKLVAVIANKGAVQSDSRKSVSFYRWNRSPGAFDRFEDLPDAWSDRAHESATVRRLKPGEEFTVSVEAIAPITPGTYYYGASVFPTKEDNLINNYSDIVSITVAGTPGQDEMEDRGNTQEDIIRDSTQSPDLVVEPPRVNRTTVGKGGSFLISAIVRNKGGVQSDATIIRYYFSTDSIISTSDIEITSDSVTALNPNGSSAKIATITVTASAPPGIHYFGVCVDSVRGERNTGNNCSSVVAVNIGSHIEVPGGSNTPGDSPFNCKVLPDAYPTQVIPDENLRKAVIDTLGGKSLRYLVSLGYKQGIKDLTGLEYATNLEELCLDTSQINDLTPLKCLTRLKGLCLLGLDHIIDLTPLENLTNLEWIETGGIGPNVDLAPLRRLKEKNPSVLIDIDIYADLNNIQGAPEIPVLPDETRLLSNYPNPFNPETWIPYQLAVDADVTVTIYDSSGRVVRNLDLGHQRAGVYQRRSRAAHWDGRNAIGETVASGVYFYTLTTGDFTATRKLLIRK